MRKVFQTLALCLMLPLAAMAQDAWNTTYKEISARIVAPTFKEKVFKPSIKPSASAKAQPESYQRCNPKV